MKLADLTAAQRHELENYQIEMADCSRHAGDLRREYAAKIGVSVEELRDLRRQLLAEINARPW